MKFKGQDDDSKFLPVGWMIEMVDLVCPYPHPHVQLCHWTFCIISMIYASSAGAATPPPVDGEGGGITGTCLGANIIIEGLGTPLEVFPCFQDDGGDAIV